MEELELRQYWAIIRKRWILVITIPIIAAIVSALVSLFVLTPKYEASTTLLVNQQTTDPQLSISEISANQALINTYTAIIKSATVADAVIEQLHLPYTAAQLDGMITVTSPTQSQVIQVSVVSPSEDTSVQIANSLAHTFQQKALNIMQVQNVQIVDPAVQPAKASPVKPNKKLNVAIAFILGLMVSIGIAFLMEYLDNRVRSEDDVRRYLQLPVLGSIVEFEAE